MKRGRGKGELLCVCVCVCEREREREISWETVPKFQLMKLQLYKQIPAHSQDTFNWPCQKVVCRPTDVSLVNHPVA
jgi:hypothetical protein